MWIVSRWLWLLVFIVRVVCLKIKHHCWLWSFVEWYLWGTVCVLDRGILVGEGRLFWGGLLIFIGVFLSGIWSVICFVSLRILQIIGLFEFLLFVFFLLHWHLNFVLKFLIFFSLLGLNLCLFPLVLFSLFSELFLIDSLLFLFSPQLGWIYAVKSLCECSIDAYWGYL